MVNLFPLGPGISRVRGVISILKQHDGHLEISELAEEADEQIDDLLPLIEACKLLGFAEIDNSEIKLTNSGAKLDFTNFSKSIRDNLADIEPFESALKIIGDREVNTQKLFSTLRSKGITLHSDEVTSDALLKKVMLRWGVRSKLLNYDSKTDKWSRRVK